jgi:hypothetical protein
VVTNLVAVHFPVHHVHGLSAVGESNAQLAAFAQSFAYLVVFRERLAVGFEPHKIKLARFGAVDTAVNPGHQQVAIRGGFDNRKASGVLDFI